MYSRFDISMHILCQFFLACDSICHAKSLSRRGEDIVRCCSTDIASRTCVCLLPKDFMLLSADKCNVDIVRCMHARCAHGVGMLAGIAA